MTETTDNAAGERECSAWDSCPNPAHRTPATPDADDASEREAFVKVLDCNAADLHSDPHVWDFGSGEHFVCFGVPDPVRTDASTGASEPLSEDVEALADLSAIIRDYLIDEVDATFPSFHATALTTRLGDWLAAREAAARAEGAAEALREAADHSKCRAIGEWYGVPAHAWGEQP